jgi:hypothetical protein
LTFHQDKINRLSSCRQGMAASRRQGCHPWPLDSGNPCRNDVVKIGIKINRLKNNTYILYKMSTEPTLVLFSCCLLISKNSSQFVTHALFRHTGRDSLGAVLPRALPVNANWFQSNLCRIKEAVSNLGYIDVSYACPGLPDRGAPCRYDAVFI